MPYTPYHSDWKDYPDTTTPITAAALDYIEAGIAAGTGPTGPSGTGGATYEYQLAGGVSAGATTITLDRTPNWLRVNSFIVIDPFTTEAEIRRVTAIAGTTITVAALTYAHSANDFVFQHDRGLVPWSWWGAVPNDTAFATANVTAFNRLTNQLYALGSFYYGGIFVPSGVWYIDGELQMERDQILEGVAIMESKIKAHTTFSFPSGETAMLHGKRDGTLVNYGSAGVSSRWSLRNIWFDGSGVTGSNGILVSPQQPDIWENVRVDYCLGYGACVTDCQQHIIKNFQGYNCGISLYLREGRFVYVDGFNSEYAAANDIKMDGFAAGGGSFANTFRNVHVENLQGTENFLFDNSAVVGAAQSSEILFDSVWVSTGGTSTVFKFSDASRPWEYALKNIRFYGSPAAVTGIRDVYRGQTLNALDEWSSRIHLYQTKFSSIASAAAPYGHHSYVVHGPTGASVRVGVPDGSGSYPTGAFMANSVSDNNHHAMFYSSGTLVNDVKRDGSMMIGAASSYIKGVLVGSTTWDPGSLADGAIAVTNVTVTGVSANMPCFAALSNITSSGWLISASCTGTDTVTVTIMNKTGGVVDLGNATVRACQVKF